MSKLSDYLEGRALELFHDAGNVRRAEERKLVVRLTVIDRFTPAFLLARDRILELLAMRAGRNRRRRSSILCKIGLHDWEAWELRAPGLMFVKRCRRRGCKVARAIKLKTLGPSSATERFWPAGSKRGGSDG